MGSLAARASRTTLACGHRGTLSAKNRGAERGRGAECGGARARGRRPPPTSPTIVPSPARPDSGGTRPHSPLAHGPPLQPQGFLPQGPGGVIPPKLGHL